MATRAPQACSRSGPTCTARISRVAAAAAAFSEFDTAAGPASSSFEFVESSVPVRCTPPPPCCEASNGRHVRHDRGGRRRTANGAIFELDRHDRSPVGRRQAQLRARRDGQAFRVRGPRATSGRPVVRHERRSGALASNGTVFSFDPGSWNDDGPARAFGPSGPVPARRGTDRSQRRSFIGRLHGAGGPLGGGTVFKWEPSAASSVTVLHAFDPLAEGGFPIRPGLTRGSDGRVYGTAAGSAAPPTCGAGCTDASTAGWSTGLDANGANFADPANRSGPDNGRRCVRAARAAARGIGGALFGTLLGGGSARAAGRYSASTRAAARFAASCVSSNPCASIGVRTRRRAHARERRARLRHDGRRWPARRRHGVPPGHIGAGGASRCCTHFDRWRTRSTVGGPNRALVHAGPSVFMGTTTRPAESTSVVACPATARSTELRCRARRLPPSVVLRIVRRLAARARSAPCPTPAARQGRRAAGCMG